MYYNNKAGFVLSSIDKTQNCSIGATRVPGCDLGHKTNAFDDASFLVTATTRFVTLHKLFIFNRAGAHASRAFHSSASTQRNATLALLEQKVASCIALQSLPEYRKWLLAYAR